MLILYKNSYIRKELQKNQTFNIGAYPSKRTIEEKENYLREIEENKENYIKFTLYDNLRIQEAYYMIKEENNKLKTFQKIEQQSFKMQCFELKRKYLELLLKMYLYIYIYMYIYIYELHM